MLFGGELVLVGIMGYLNAMQRPAPSSISPKRAKKTQSESLLLVLTAAVH